METFRCCFNCNFKCGYRVGGTITTRFKSLLEWLGADKITIDKLTLEAMKIAAENAGTGLVCQSVMVAVNRRFY